MRTMILGLAGILAAGATDLHAGAQQSRLDRLPSALLDVRPPSERVTGEPGQMRVVGGACVDRPMSETRRRIVDVAVQEWAYFGFSISDQMVLRNSPSPRRSLTSNANAPRGGRRFGGLNADEAGRLADSIAGYWTATPDAGWILDRQNEAWNGPRGVASRWRDPWSAAFISWVMCESGLGSDAQFRRAIAHHTYIDQAIRARDEGVSGAAFVAYDSGETTLDPGDLLCTARRPGYDSLADRRRQMGEGARMHCDIVVEVDQTGGRILTIGGNVRGTVSLKLLPAVEEGETLRARTDIFAHLKLRADPIGPDGLGTSPTIRALGCLAGFRPPAALAAANLTPPSSPPAQC